MLGLDAAKTGNESKHPTDMALPASADTLRHPGRLLDADEVPPVMEENAGSQSPFFFTCDHYDFADRLHAFDILASLR